MKFTILLTFLPIFASALPEALPEPHYPSQKAAAKCCLRKSDVDRIMNTYGVLFKSRKEAEIRKASYILSPDFKEYDESQNEGKSPVMAKSRDEFVKTALAGLKLKQPIRDLQIKELYRFNDCNDVALRYQATAKATGVYEFSPGIFLPINTTAVPVGSTVSWKGVTIYKIDCHKKQIKAIYQSQDTNNYIAGIGLNVCALGA